MICIYILVNLYNYIFYRAIGNMLNYCLQQNSFNEWIYAGHLKLVS
jgi:hypothetical protein